MVDSALNARNLMKMSVKFCLLGLLWHTDRWLRDMLRGFDRMDYVLSLHQKDFFFFFFSSLVCVTRLILTSSWSRVSIADMLSGVAMTSHGQRRGWLDLVQPISGSHYFLGCFSMLKVCHRFASVWSPAQLRLLQCRREHHPHVHPNWWR